MEGKISVNGVICDSVAAGVPALDRGFLFGESIFEVFVVFQDVFLDEHAHLVRLRESADYAGISIPWQNEELMFEMRELVRQVKGEKKYVRLVITGGNGLGLKTEEHSEPNKMVYCLPAKQQLPGIYQDGIVLKTVRTTAIERGAAPKVSNYLNGIKALKDSARQGFDDVLWVNADGELTECTTSNIFLLGRHGDLVEVATPPAHSGLLLGITRARIKELLERSSIPVTERAIYTDELPGFDEAFVCSTVRGLVPISKINGQRLHSARPGSVYRHVERLYMAYVASEVGMKVDWNTGKSC